MESLGILKIVLFENAELLPFSILVTTGYDSSVYTHTKRVERFNALGINSISAFNRKISVAY